MDTGNIIKNTVGAAVAIIMVIGILVAVVGAGVLVSRNGGEGDSRVLETPVEGVTA